MGSISYVTQEGLDKMKEELIRLETYERPRISQQIAEARDKGDLSENAEYDAAKEAQGMLEAKIAQLKEQISQSRLIDKSKIDQSKVQILSQVKLKNVKNGATKSYTIVSESEADLKQNKIAISTPIAQGLVGKRKGDIAKIKVPNGTMEFEIVDITY